jgi:hypothetical protein
MMIGYDIYDRFTTEHFPLCQRMILTTSFFFFLVATVDTVIFFIFKNACISKMTDVLNLTTSNYNRLF